MQEKPELAASVRKKLGEIRQCWAELESTTQAKARQLFEARHPNELVRDERTFFNIDLMQRGLGNPTCGEDGLYEYLEARYEELLVRIEQGQWEASDVETLKEALKGYKR